MKSETKIGRPPLPDSERADSQIQLRVVEKQLNESTTQCSNQQKNIALLHGELDQFKQIAAELAKSLKELLGECKKVPEMNLVYYDSLGIQVNESLNRYNSLLQSESPSKSPTCKVCGKETTTGGKFTSSQPDTQRFTLTVEEIRDLAQFCGMVVQEPTASEKEDERETKIVVAPWPERGVKDEEGIAVLPPHKHIAYFAEYPEEGCMSLGSAIPQQEGKKP